MKFLVALVSIMASVDDSSMVSVIFRLIGSMMHFRSSLRERMMSLHSISFSHLGWHSLWESGLSAASASVRSGFGLLCRVYVHQDGVTW